jgi:hypothetical protein
LVDLLIERVTWRPDAIRLDQRDLADDAINRTKAALLANVARLEACVDAARDTIVNHYGPFAEIRKALAALDRPEDGETK